MKLPLIGKVSTPWVLGGLAAVAFFWWLKKSSDAPLFTFQPQAEPVLPANFGQQLREWLERNASEQKNRPH